MWEWVGDHSWAAWVSVALVLAAAELISLDFVLVMLAIGAGAGAITAALGGSTAIALVAAIVVSVAMLGAVRPSMVKRMHGGAELTTGHDALIGRTGVVLSPVGRRTGQIRLAGEVWTARSFDPGLTIDPGAEVEVFEIDGATAVVYPAD
jgi:membrane protein implicated in regulation of membrane protease activity